MSKSIIRNEEEFLNNLIKGDGPKMRLENLFINAQLVCDKAGGLITKTALKRMSLPHFFAICILNNIQITFHTKKPNK